MSEVFEGLKELLSSKYIKFWVVKDVLKAHTLIYIIRWVSQRPPPPWICSPSMYFELLNARREIFRENMLGLVSWITCWKSRLPPAFLRAAPHPPQYVFQYLEFLKTWKFLFVKLYLRFGVLNYVLKVRTPNCTASWSCATFPLSQYIFWHLKLWRVRNISWCFHINL